MSPRWWDRWQPTSLPMEGQSVNPAVNRRVPAGASALPVVLMPDDWSVVWNQIRQWAEASQALRGRIDIFPPLGPRRFVFDFENRPSTCDRATATIILASQVVGTVELFYPALNRAEDSPSTPRLADANRWADAIATLIREGAASNPSDHHAA